MAGDSSVWSGQLWSGNHKKVFKNPDGMLLGCAGSTNAINRYAEWFMAGGCGTPPKHARDLEAIIVHSNGDLFGVDGRVVGMTPFPMDYVEKHGFVIGMGIDFVMGLLAAGKTAEEALKIARRRVAYVDGKIHTVSLDKMKKGL